jgi:opacity protein-like surface antigen
MRRIITAAVFALVLGSAAAADAQDRWPERIWLGVSGGVQAGGSGFDDRFELPLNAETERVDVEYPVKSGALVAVRGGYRVWRRIAIGAGVTRFSQRGGARVEAQLPHPFFDNQFRQVEGTTSTLRGETAAHLLLGWMQPLSARARLLVTAGPSFVSTEQTLVTDVRFSEAYPYDTAEFTGATTRRETRGAPGFNAGADLTWMFSRRMGAGALVQFTRARVRLNAGEGRRIAVDAGGVQAAAGLRLFF